MSDTVKTTIEFRRADPILPALDISESAGFYEENLGFTRTNDDADYAVLERDAVEVHLWKTNDRNLSENTSCRFAVTDVEALYEQLNPKGVVHPNAHLREERGRKEFAVLDPAGVLVWFVEVAG